MTKKTSISLVGATLPEPPRKLGATGLQLWRDVQAQYRILDVGGIETLLQICLAADRVWAMLRRSSRAGEMLEGPHGANANPLLRDELACRAFIVRSLRVLGLNLEDVGTLGRPAGKTFPGIGWDKL